MKFLHLPAPLVSINEIHMHLKEASSFAGKVLDSFELVNIPACMMKCKTTPKFLQLRKKVMVSRVNALLFVYLNMVLFTCTT